MTVNRTTLLDLPLPVTGTEAGTWGDITNKGLTEYLDIAIAGALSVTSSVTLDTTEGTSTATNIGSTTAQYRTLLVPASGVSGNIVITAPASNRTYHVINRNATHTVQVRAGAGTGVTIGVNQSATVAYNGTDYALVGPIGPVVPVANGGSGATTLTGVLKGNGTSAFTAGQVSLTTEVTGTLPIGNGGTGQTTAQTAINALAGATTSGQYLRGNGTNVVMSAIQAGDVPTLNQNTTGSAATLTTGRTIQTNLASTSSATFNGSANITPGVTGTLPVGNGGTGITSFGTGVATALGQNVTGSGGIALATSPSFTTPTLGVATATSINKLTITAPATSATLTVANGKTLTANNSLTLAGTDATTMTFPSTSQTIAGLGVAQTFTAAQTFRAANAIRSEAASTQDAIVIAGRAGGSNSYAVTLTPNTLTANRTLTLPDPGSNETLGYINTPINSRSAAYTAVLADAGKTILHPIADNNARTFTIPAESSVNYPIGTVISFVNLINTVTIAITTDTMYLANDGATGSRTLAPYGMASAMKVASATWIISGSGLT